MWPTFVITQIDLIINESSGSIGDKRGNHMRLTNLTIVEEQSLKATPTLRLRLARGKWLFYQKTATNISIYIYITSGLTPEILDITHDSWSIPPYCWSTRETLFLSMHQAEIDPFRAPENTCCCLGCEEKVFLPSIDSPENEQITIEKQSFEDVSTIGKRWFSNPHPLRGGTSKNVLYI